VTAKTFTEEEHLAVLASRTATEVEQAKAEWAEERANLIATNEAKDVEIAKITAERDEARSELAKINEEKEQAALGAARVEEAKAAAALPEGYFTPEVASKYGAMDQATWGVVLDALKAASPAGTSGAREAASAGKQLGDEGTGGEKFVARPSVFGGNFGD